MSAKGQGDPGEDHASRVGAESPCSDMKRAVAKKLIERYFYQLTDGCGNPDCDNQNCASSGKITNLTPNQAAAQAIQLFSQEARLCDGTQPSKVARTTLEPGPASLAKSLPVKSVNPTCSDEGIPSNSGTNPAPLDNESVIPLVDMDIPMTESDPIPEAITFENMQSSSNSKLANQTNEIFIEPISKEKSAISLAIGQTRVNSNSHLCEFCKFNLSCAATVASRSMVSDEESFQKILDKYNICIPNYSTDPIKKQHKRSKNVKKASMKHRLKKNIKHKRNASTKGCKVKNCSRFVTKLLVLNMYLRYLEKERYTKI